VSAKVYAHKLLATVTLFMVAGVVSTVLATSAWARCPANEQIRAQEVHALRLPDCRAYEQASPVDKGGADAVGLLGLVQSSPSGGGVTFYSVLPFPGVPGAAEFPIYLSSRGTTKWSTQGLVPPSDPGTFPYVVGMTEDLAKTIVSAQEPPLVGQGATPGRYNRYIYESATGIYQRLAGPGELSFADATPDDSHILFEDEAQLTKGAVEEVPNLYEWDDGLVRLVGVLPDGEAPASGAAAGARSTTYQQDTISENGARVFFTDVSTRQIYMREPGSENGQGRTIPISEGSAEWRAATPGGSYVFYLENEKLYRFNVEREKSEELTSGEAGVLGTFGVSSDGSYVYFVATQVLTEGANKAGKKAEEGATNLYEWHENTSEPTKAMTFVASLNRVEDEADWRDRIEAAEGYGPDAGGKSSRVTPIGTTMLFTSVEQLTNYNNAGHFEIYLYEAPSEHITCVSCNPSGGGATSSSYLTHLAVSPPAPIKRNLFLTRNLSADGNRVFFQTSEALVPQDTNGQMDVYEWEREGSGSCATGHGDCFYLISTGQDPSESYFGDASANGSDVFFFTRQSLVGQDQDSNVDVYNAREDGGIAAQNPPPPAEACADEVACRSGAPSSLPVLGAPSSATFSGVGNLAPPSKPKTVSLTRAQKLSKALKVCKGKKVKKKRTVCEAQARRRYGKSKAKKSSRRGQ
jgi:hypothetical protein